jgi:hypothetical protein
VKGVIEMTPEQVRERNCRNAEKSTGPQTSVGRAIVAMNTLKHGLRSSTVLIPGEDIEAWETLCAELKAELQPMRIREWLCVELIAGAAWRLRRLRMLEAGVLRAQLITTQLGQAHEEAKRHERVPVTDTLALVEVTVTDFQAHRVALDRVDALEVQRREDLATLGSAVSREITCLTLGTLSRYEADLQRTLFKALHELERLQTLRLSAGVLKTPSARSRRLPQKLALFGKNAADGL